MKTYQAQPYQSSNPEQALIFGYVMNQINSPAVDLLLEKHGFGDMQPDAWYLQQAVLNLLLDIDKSLSFDELVAMEMHTTTIVVPQKMPLEALPQFVSDMYHQVHQHIHPEEGWYFSDISRDSLHAVANMPYPSFMSYGFLYQAIRHMVIGGLEKYILKLDMHANLPTFDIARR